MWDWIGKLAELREKNQKALLVSVVGSSGSTPRKKGAKMIVLPDGTFFGTVGGGAIEQFALEKARDYFTPTKGECSLPSGQQMESLPICGGTMELFMEVINDTPSLYLFGAGHVGQALCRVLEGTPFCIHLIDERPEWINSPSLSSSVIRHLCHWNSFIAHANWCPERSFVVIATYDGDIDGQILSEALGHPARYMGMIGSRSKWQRIRKELEEVGRDPSRVTCPIGHANGGDAPQEIAISIANQVLATWYGTGSI